MLRGVALGCITAIAMLVTELRRNERGWYVELIRFRTHCRRGNDPEAGECV